MTTTARVVADSVSPQGKRLITWVTRYPWQIHGEVKTHRLLVSGDEGAVEVFKEAGLMDDRNLSRNASSNRAVPIAKMLEEVRSDELRAYPSFAVMAGKGMQGGEPMTEGKRALAKALWADAARSAAYYAEVMMDEGFAKQDVNRLLMPFTHANVIITATEVDNFFGLRLDAAADPTMRALAVAMWEAMKASTPRLCRPGKNWHLPFFEPDDWHALEEHFLHNGTDETQDRWMTGSGDYSGSFGKDMAIRVSVARCARVSYQSFETGKLSTVTEDLALYDRLVGQRVLHASPAEHQGTPDTKSPQDVDCHDPSMTEAWDHPHEHGNLVGWRQLRKMLPGEDRAPLPEGYSL